MQTSKYRHAALCALVSSRINITARMKKAYWAATGLLVDRARIARAAAGPRGAAAIALFHRWSAVSASRLRSVRRRIAHELVLRALHTGDVSSDLDRRGAACRTAMWCFVALAVLMWPALGWKSSIVPLLTALTFGGVATIFWEAAGELERREHPHWERSADM